MKSKLLLPILLFLFALPSGAYSQQRVILQSNGNSIAFGTANSFIDAYNEAQDGDTIYLPGLQYTSPTSFNKRLVVYGTGHDPESTASTGRTIINGFTFDPGASGSHLEGIYVSSGITFRSNNKTDDVTLKRVHINGQILIAGTDPENRCDNILITESIFGGLNGQNASNIKVFNSFSNGRLQYLNENSWIANSFIYDYFYPVYYAVQSRFENNIIVVYTSNTGVSNSNGNTFSNNIFNRNPTTQENNTWSGNYTDVDPAGLFEDYQNPFSYEADYKLKNPGSYTGTTGDQAGLFGGHYPYKENALPVTPHIQDHNIATSADEDGNLQINVSVQAQQQ